MQTDGEGHHRLSRASFSSDALEGRFELRSGSMSSIHGLDQPESELEPDNTHTSQNTENTDHARKEIFDETEKIGDPEDADTTETDSSTDASTGTHSVFQSKWQQALRRAPLPSSSHLSTEAQSFLQLIERTPSNHRHFDYVLMQIREVIRHVDGVNMMIQVLEVLALGCRWQKLVVIVADMIGHGLPPNRHIHRLMILACAHVGHYRECLHFFREMIEKNMEPCADCFGVSILACTELQRFDKSLELFSKAKQAGHHPSLTLYNCILVASIQKNSDTDFGFVLALFKDAVKEGLQPTPNMYFRAIVKFASVGQWMKTIILYEHFRKIYPNNRLPTSNFYTTIIHAYHSCHPTLKYAGHGKPKRSILARLVGLFEELKDAVAGKEVENETSFVEEPLQRTMGKLVYYDGQHVNKPAYIGPSTICYNIMITACMREKQLQKAFEFFLAMKNEKVHITLSPTPCLGNQKRRICAWLTRSTHNYHQLVSLMHSALEYAARIPTHLTTLVEQRARQDDVRVDY